MIRQLIRDIIDYPCDFIQSLLAAVCAFGGMYLLVLIVGALI